MNNTVDESPEPKLGYAVFIGCIIALGLPLNAVSLWTLIRHHSLKSPSAVFMVNLAISDLLLVISLPTRVYLYATGTWPLGGTACLWVTLLFRNNIRSGSIFITYISVDRLLAVVYPLRSRLLRTSSNAWKAAALAWLFVVVVNIPQSLDLSKNLNNYSESCFEYHRYQSPTARRNVYSQLVVVLTMLTVNVVSTVLVSWTLRRHLSDSVRVKNKVNVMLIFFMNLIMFTICFVPISVGLLIFEKTAMTPLVCLASVNCCLDPLLYYFSMDAFWKKKEDADLALGQQTK